MFELIDRSPQLRKLAWGALVVVPITAIAWKVDVILLAWARLAH